MTPIPDADFLDGIPLIITIPALLGAARVVTTRSVKSAWRHCWDHAPVTPWRSAFELARDLDACRRPALGQPWRGIDDVLPSDWDTVYGWDVVIGNAAHTGLIASRSALPPVHIFAGYIHAVERTTAIITIHGATV